MMLLTPPHPQSFWPWGGGRAASPLSLPLLQKQASLPQRHLGTQAEPLHTLPARAPPWVTCQRVERGGSRRENPSPAPLSGEAGDGFEEGRFTGSQLYLGLSAGFSPAPASHQQGDGPRAHPFPSLARSFTQWGSTAGALYHVGRH